MKSYKLSPREKIHEALSVIADNRIEINENSALVTSSDYTKKYIVEWENNIYSSNDNASYWQGYPGYPIISILLLTNKLNYNNSILPYFKNINWKELNKKNKNNYAKVVEGIYHELEDKKINIKDIDREIDNIYNQLCNLDIDTKRSKEFPPK